VVTEELLAAGVPVGAHWITDRQSGPVLLKFGTEEQRLQWLPRIVRAEVAFCIGMSEPDSGSDLASLRTGGSRVDGGWLINGHKIWTTWAHHADWIFALIRTDRNAPRKQAGISFILIDMKTPGINPQGIKTIAGDDEFAQVFFDNVKVPIKNLVGPLNDGWRIANSLLAHERLGNANPQNCMDALDRVRAEHHGRNVLLVSSGGPIATAVGRVLGTSPGATIELNLRIRNCSVTEFAFTPKRHMLVGYNAIGHFDGPAYRDWVTYA